MQEAEASGEESDHRKRRLSRRKRRTEMSISLEETPGAAALSQPTAPFVSQPDISNQGNSSPRVNDIPLTQPDRGAFESRVPQGKTKFKRKKAAGFR
jgi:RNA polymerase I-specific transcription initiation factor RRN6